MKRNILKAVSALLAVSVVLSLASCKKPDKNDQTQQKKRSGTRITEDSPWFDCTQYDLTPPIDTNRETELLQQWLVGYDDRYLVVSTTGEYVRPADYSGDWNTLEFTFAYASVIDRTTKQTVQTIDFMEGIAPGAGRGQTSYSDGKVFQRYTVDDVGGMRFEENVYSADTGKLIETRSYDPAKNADPLSTYKLGKYTIVTNWVYDGNAKQSYYDLYVKSPDGSEKTVQLKEESGSIETLYFIALKDDSTAVIPISTGIQTKFYELDLKALTLKYAALTDYEWLDLSRCSNSSQGSDGSVYIPSSTGISKVDFQAKKLEEYFDYNDCDVNIYKLGGLKISDIKGDTILLSGEDNSRYVYGQDSDHSRFEIVELTKAKKNPHAGKTVLEMYSAESLSDGRIGDAITKFNNTNGSYYIEMTNRYDQSLAERSSASSDDDFFMADLNISSKLGTRLATDIMSGNGPDILLNAAYLGQLNSDNYLADLTPFFDSLDSSKYFSGIIDACRTGGKIYNLPVTFEICGIQTKQEYAGASGTGFTAAEYAKFLNESLNGNDIIKYGQPYYFALLFNAMREQFIVNGKADFSGPEFEELATFVKDNVCEKSKNWGDFTSSYLEEPESAPRARRVNCFDPFDYMVTSAELQGCPAILGYPSADGRGPLVNPKFSVAVSAQAKDVNACGEFVKLLLSDEIQNDLATGGTLVVNRSAFRKGAEAALSYINGDGYGNYFAGGGDPNDHRIIFSSQDIDNLEKIITSCSGTNSVDADISIVLIEEMPAYFLGQKDLASVIKIAQDRAQKVLDERK
jgi:hypothetical protein